MARTVKVLSEINNTREEISHIVALLNKRQDLKINLTNIVRAKPLDSAIFAIILGIFAALLSGKIKSILKFAFLIYAIKQNISRLSKT